MKNIITRPVSFTHIQLMLGAESGKAGRHWHGGTEGEKG